MAYNWGGGRTEIAAYPEHHFKLSRVKSENLFEKKFGGNPFSFFEPPF